MRRRAKGTEIGWLIAVAVLTLAMILAVGPADAHARWPRGSTRRVVRHAETIEGAARIYGVDPVLLAAVCVHETGLQPLRGGAGRAMWGPCQTYWATWGEQLEVAGIALEPDDLLEPDLIAGLLAGAYVLARIDALRSSWAPWRRLCAYGTGGKLAATLEESCAYGDAVARNIPRARLALAVAAAMRLRFGAREE